MNWVLWHHWWVIHWRRSLGLVSICNKTRLSPKVVANLNVKYHMECDILIYWRQLWYVILPKFKIWSDVLNFFSYGVPPKDISVFFAWCLCLLYWLGYLDAKLVRINPILWFLLSNSMVAFFQQIPYTPCKCRVACNTALYHIFGNLYRIGIINILEGYPCSAPILPFN